MAVSKKKKMFCKVLGYFSFINNIVYFKNLNTRRARGVYQKR